MLAKRMGRNDRLKGVTSSGLVGLRLIVVVEGRGHVGFH